MDEIKSITTPWLTTTLVVQDMILLDHVVETEYLDGH
jgi:hypothetical protein